MAEIVSLSKHRKARAHAAKAATAVENRTKFGRSKADKQRDAAERELAARKADAHKRDN